MEKLFEEVEERKNHHKVWPREDKEEEEEDFYDNNIDEDEDDDYEYNGEHKSDLDENIIRAAEEEFKNDRDTNKKAIEKKQVTKLTTSTPTTLPKTTHRPTTTKKRIPTTTATGSSTRRLINSSHRHRLQPEQFRYHRRYHYRHPLVRTFHRGNNQRFTLSRQEDSTGGKFYSYVRIYNGNRGTDIRLFAS